MYISYILFIIYVISTYAEVLLAVELRKGLGCLGGLVVVALKGVCDWLGWGDG